MPIWYLFRYYLVIMTGQLSGEERRSRIEDLARGNHSQEELAEKYGITLQTMREFSARNQTRLPPVRLSCRAS